MKRSYTFGAVGAGLAAAVVAAGVAGATPAPSEGTVTAGSQTSLTLTVGDVHGMEQAALSASNPHSAGYRKFLSRDQLRSRFGASPDKVARVEQWARGAGFGIAGLDASGTHLTLTGTTAHAANVFGVKLAQRVVRGVLSTAPTSALKVPGAIAGDVSAASGMSVIPSFPSHVTPSTTHPAAGAPGDNACSRYWGEHLNTAVPQKYPGVESNMICGYHANQLRSLYGLTPRDTGAGQTVAIVGAYDNPTALADLNRAAVRDGLPPVAPGQYQVKTYSDIPKQKDCDAQSWYGEQNLDLQTVHAIAPAARIVYVAAPDCTQNENALAHAINDPTLGATVISNSWTSQGEPDDPQYLEQTNEALAQAAALGIGTTFSSGDEGDGSTGGGQPSANFPASSPWTTAVGGTTSGLGPDGKLARTPDGTPIETGWADTANVLVNGRWQPADKPLQGAAGGGPSHHFPLPSWQTGVPAEMSRGMRTVPDIAALADAYTGIALIDSSSGRTQEHPEGGTSLASPIVTALVAVAQSRNNSDVGFLAPTLYAKGSSVITDVAHVNAGILYPGAGELLDADGRIQTLVTAPGYDTRTGLGRPSAGFLSGITQ